MYLWLPSLHQDLQEGIHLSVGAEHLGERLSLQPAKETVANIVSFKPDRMEVINLSMYAMFVNKVVHTTII